MNFLSVKKTRQSSNLEVGDDKDIIFAVWIFMSSSDIKTVKYHDILFWNGSMRPTNPTVIVSAEPLLVGIILYLGQCRKIKLAFCNKTWLKEQIIGPFFLAPWNQAKIQFQFTKTKSANTNGKQGKNWDSNSRPKLS